VEEGMGESAQHMLQVPQAFSAQLVLTGLLNDLAALPYRMVLVLDDLHLISDETILEGLAFVLDHQPHQLYLVLSTRADPSLPIIRLRARGQLSEVRVDDLAFTVDEAAMFRNDLKHVRLKVKDPAQAADLAMKIQTEASHR
jgi:LuxR family maltose regulon positive regulatory protein